MSASVCESHTHQKTCKKSLTCKDGEWKAISSATCHGTRYLSGALVVHGNRDEPLPFTWPNKKKGHGTALSISYLFLSPSSNSESVLENTSWHWLKVLFASARPANVVSIAGHIIYVVSGVDYI